MSENAQKPRIRFKGFSDAWEQRKLGDMVKEVTRRDANSNAPIMMITANNGFIEQSERYAFNNAGESLKKYIILQKEELAYNHGASKLRPYGSCFALTTAENARVPFVYHCFSAERMNPEFLSIELNGNEIESQLRSIVSSGARMDGLLNISFGEYTSVSILFPKKNEQDKIADFFRQLDNLITLHQCKVFYKNIIFKNIKFGGLETENNTSWEQRKFEDLYNYASEGGTPDTNNSSFYENGDVPFVKIEDTENKYIDSTKSYITQEGLSHSSAWLIPKSSVIFTNGATVGNVAINRLPVATKQGILGIIPSKNVVTEFLFYLLSSSTFQREVRSRMATGTFATIILKNLNQIPVCIPSDKSEQEEIAGYLSAFDNLITLHQRIKIFFTGDYHDQKNK